MTVPGRRIAASSSIAAAALAWAAAAPASAPAADVTLWACHGPGGQALGVPPLVAATSGDGVIAAYGAGCGGPAGALGDGGVRATFTRPDPAGGSSARWRLDLPSDLTVAGVRLARRTLGLGTLPAGDGGGQDYTSETSAGPLEVVDAGGAARDGVLSAAAPGASFVRFGVACTRTAVERCAAPSSAALGVDVGSIAVAVHDDFAPRGAVGGATSPAAGRLALSVRATDAGIGLARTQALLDGRIVAQADLGGASCAELSPQDATVDLAVTATCPTSVPDAPLTVDTTTVADGPHQLTVVVTDAAGQSTTAFDEPIVVANTPAGSSNTATLAIGTGATAAGGAAAGGPSGAGVGGAGGATGTSAAPCPKPSLSVFLREKPLRVSRGVAVLRRGGRYRYGGRLTCTVDGKPRSAKAGLLVDILNKVGSRTLSKGGVATGPGGTVSMILAYPSSRTVQFRYRGTDGATARVSIKITIAKAAR
jgi:hypothetical protein